MKKVTERGITVYVPESNLEDTPRYKHRFTVNSESSDAKYMLSYDTAPGAGYWTCSCRGNIRHGRCKHLETLRLLTRYDVTVRRVR